MPSVRPKVFEWARIGGVSLVCEPLAPSGGRRLSLGNGYEVAELLSQTSSKVS